MAHPITRPLLGLVTVLAGALLLAGPVAGRPAGQTTVPAGTWETFASGDDVLALAVEGDVLWSGTRAGGLVRWDRTSRTYVQYLRPQAPLGGNTVYDIAIGPDGRKWLATEHGLTVFDDGGTAQRDDDVWRTYTRENTFDGLPSDDVRAVAVDGDLVWVGGLQTWDEAQEAWVGGGLGRLNTAGTPQTDDDSWMAVQTFDGTRDEAPDGTTRLGLVSDNVLDLAVTGEGNVWVATGPHMRLERDANRDNPGMQWQARHGGVSFLLTNGTPDREDDDWKSVSCETADLTITCPVRSVAIDGAGFAWLAVGGRGVAYFNADAPVFSDTSRSRFTPPDGRFVQDIAFGPPDDSALANRVYLATRDGGVAVLDHNGTLLVRTDDEWAAPLTMADGLPSNRVQALEQLDDGLWLGMGPVRAIPGGLHRLSLTSGELDDQLMTAVEPCAAPAAGAPPTNFITSLAFGAADTRWEGHVWIGTGSRAERRFGVGVLDLDTAGTQTSADDRWRSYDATCTDGDGQPPFDGLAGDNVQDVAVDGDRVWIGSTETLWNREAGAYRDGGLTVFDGEDWTARSTETDENGLQDGSVSSVTLGCEGDVWVGTGSYWDYNGAGVSVLVPGNVHQLDDDMWTTHRYPDLASDNTTDVAVDCDGQRVWVTATHHDIGGGWIGGGVATRPLADGEWQKYDTRDGFESYSDEALRAEAMTVITASGGTALVGAYGTSDMSQSALIEQGPFWPAMLNRWDGSAWSHERFERAGWVSSIARDDDGRLWLATSRGGAARESATPESWYLESEEGGLFVRHPDDAAWLRLDARESGLPSNDISAVAVAPDGDIWVGTEGWGLARFKIGGVPATATPTSDLRSPTPTVTPSATPTAQEPTPTTTPATATPGTPGTPTSGTPGTGGTPTATPSPTGGRAPTATPSGPVWQQIYLPHVEQGPALTRADFRGRRP